MYVSVSETCVAEQFTKLNILRKENRRNLLWKFVSEVKLDPAKLGCVDYRLKRSLANSANARKRGETRFQTSPLFCCEERSHSAQPEEKLETRQIRAKVCPLKASSPLKAESREPRVWERRGSRFPHFRLVFARGIVVAIAQIRVTPLLRGETKRNVESAVSACC